MKLVQKAIIKKDDNYLVLLRSKEDIHFPLHWDFPGGKIDEGEDPQTALIREVLEETGLNIEPGQFVWETDLESYEEKFRLFIYNVKIISGEIKLSNEHSDFKWASKKDLLRMKIEPYMQMFFNESKD